MHKHLPKFNDNSYAHFITARTCDSRPYFKNDEFACILCEELKFYSQGYGFALLGYVIMPDHKHLLLWWDKEEKPELSVSKIMQSIKSGSARRIIDLMKSKGLEQVLQPTRREGRLQATRNRDSYPKSHRRNLKYRFWQPGFYDFNVYNEAKLIEKLDYMHNNPVKAGLVVSPSDYDWSSYKEYF